MKNILFLPSMVDCYWWDKTELVMLYSIEVRWVEVAESILGWVTNSIHLNECNSKDKRIKQKLRHYDWSCFFEIENSNRTHLPNKISSGSFGFNVKRVRSLYKVAKTSKFSAERENTGKHCARTSPHMRITTNSSRMLFRATISLLISYFNLRKKGIKMKLYKVNTPRILKNNLRNYFNTRRRCGTKFFQKWVLLLHCTTDSHENLYWQVFGYGGCFGAFFSNLTAGWRFSKISFKNWTLFNQLRFTDFTLGELNMRIKENKFDMRMRQRNDDEKFQWIL